ncbi:MAG TPA: tRNA (adenosine(37)-N6)-threonylcarbamoyltransferase complex ATPase subunit type 1 TsaE, partial [Balneolaceae bacterium]|nr:tRNA (adenosine(37)-N6)-threonylcarbamoyltransferase complex ATPase subunit type 1 TsaE [Balneolaceae bacterium]
MEKEFTTTSPEETIARGKEFAGELYPGAVVCLHGDLGAGKTHFVKGIAEALSIDQADVQSPTFTLINELDGNM